MHPFVGLDVGTTGVKAVAVTESGEVVARAERGYPLSTPQPGWCEQDPEDWWQASQAALADLGVEPAAIGLSGQMHGLVALDAHDRVLRPAILWNDQRTGAECTEIEERVGLERLIELTGNRALTGFTAPKLLWLRRHEPDVYASIERILLPKDYVRLRLTGEHAIDVADASGTLLFDVRRRAWSDEVLGLLDVPASWLPPVHESTEIAGAGDQAAGALGMGVDRPGPLSVVLGTSGVVFAALPAYRPDAEARLHVFCHAVPDTWHAMGVMLSAAGSLRWLRDNVVGASYDELTAEAARWAPGAEGLLFQPYLAGERTPHAGPGCARRVRRALAASRARRDRARGARGRRVRASRLAGAAARAGRRRRGRPRLRRRRTQPALAGDRRVGARRSTRTDCRVRGRRSVRRRAARRASRRARSRMRTRQWPRASTSPTGSSRAPNGCPRTTRGTRAIASSTRRSSRSSARS